MHSCFWLWISPLLSPEYGANKMLFSGHFQKCLTGEVCELVTCGGSQRDGETLDGETLRLEQRFP